MASKKPRTPQKIRTRVSTKAKIKKMRDYHAKQYGHFELEYEEIPFRKAVTTATSSMVHGWFYKLANRIKRK